MQRNPRRRAGLGGYTPQGEAKIFEDFGRLQPADHAHHRSAKQRQMFIPVFLDIGQGRPIQIPFDGGMGLVMSIGLVPGGDGELVRGQVLRREVAFGIGVGFLRSQFVGGEGHSPQPVHRVFQTFLPLVHRAVIVEPQVVGHGFRVGLRRSRRNRRTNHHVLQQMRPLRLLGAVPG